MFSQFTCCLIPKKILNSLIKSNKQNFKLQWNLIIFYRLSFFSLVFLDGYVASESQISYILDIFL